MNCHAARAVLDLHAEGRLRPGRAAAVAGHLSGCAACRSLASPPSATPSSSAPAALKARLLAAARSAPPARGPQGGLSLLPRDAASVAAAALALGLIALGLGWNGAPNQSFEAGDELAGRRP